MASLWLGLGALTAAGLATWLTYEQTRSPVVPAPPAPTTDAAPGELPRLEVEAPVLASLRATLERPLFDDDRRPDPPGETTGAKPEQPDATKALPARLSAVVVGADGRRSVLVQITGQDQPLLVGKGDQVAGWQVDEIEDEAVVLSAAGQRAVVPLRVFDAPAAKRPAARPPAQRRAGDAARRPVAPKAAADADARAPQADTQAAGQPPRGAVPRPVEQTAPKNRN